MNCPKCGYAMSAFDLDCPRCKRVDQSVNQSQQAGSPTQQPSQELVNYVTQARSKGLIDQVIREHLLQTGWSAPVVDSYLSDQQKSKHSISTPPQKVSNDSILLPSSQPDALEFPRTEDLSVANMPSNYGLGFTAFFVIIIVTGISLGIGGTYGPWCLMGATIIWMAVDAGQISRKGYQLPGFSPTIAVVCGLLFWIIALPWYIVARDRLTRALAEIGVYIGGLGELFAYAGVGLVIALIINMADTSALQDTQPSSQQPQTQQQQQQQAPIQSTQRRQSSEKDRITLAYQQIQHGMTMNQVLTIAGNPSDTQTTEVVVMGQKYRTDYWYYMYGSGMVQIGFENGIVNSKASY